jgi:hypothetical protein
MNPCLPAEGALEGTVTPKQYEEVHHPAHYELPGGLEVMDLVEDMPFCLGNAVKYLLRAGRKPGTPAITDLSKALVYIEREIQRLARQEST